MSNNLFNSKNLWIDLETAKLLGIDKQKVVSINGDKVSIQHFYLNSPEFSLPLFALRAEELFKLLSKQSPDLLKFRVFSNFEENISRLFSNDYSSIEILASSNQILEDKKEMPEEERINIFFQNNEIASTKLSQTSSKKLKKISDKKKELEEKLIQLKLELKKQLFQQIIKSDSSISTTQKFDAIEGQKQDDLKKDESKPNVDVIEVDSIDDVVLDNEGNILDTNNNLSKKKKEKVKNKKEKKQSQPEIIESDYNINKLESNNTEEEPKVVPSYEMDDELSAIDEITFQDGTNDEGQYIDYESQSIDYIDKSSYSKESLKISNIINKIKRKIDNFQGKLSSIVGQKVKTSEEFRSIYNKASTELENIKAKAKIAKKISNEEFDKVKPYLVAELQSLVFVCYDAMCEANVVYDSSNEMFAKLILLIKRHLSMFDQVRE